MFPDSVQLHVYGLSYPFFRIFVLLAAIAVGLVLWAVIQRTRYGMIVRAGVDDRHGLRARDQHPARLRWSLLRRLPGRVLVACSAAR